MPRLELPPNKGWPPPDDELMTESGQVLLDRARVWEMLEWALFFNAHQDFTYNAAWGDKDLFRVGFLAAGQHEHFNQVGRSRSRRAAPRLLRCLHCWRAAGSGGLRVSPPPPLVALPQVKLPLSFAFEIPNSNFGTSGVRGFLQYAPGGTAAFLHRTGGDPSKFTPELPKEFNITYISQPLPCKWSATHWPQATQATKPMEAGAGGRCLTSGLDVPALPASCYSAGLDPDNDLAVFALAPGGALLKVLEAHDAAFELFKQRQGEGL